MSTVDLFEDDLIKKVMARISVRLHAVQRLGGVSISVLLVDNQTGHGVLSSGPPLTLNIAVTTPVLVASG